MNTTNSAALAVTNRRCVLSFRAQRNNLNHHLWFNNGCWWLHCTVHLPDFTKLRIRRSLRTSDVVVARAERDAILAEFRAGRKEAA
jgi:hypothetical protein